MFITKNTNKEIEMCDCFSTKKIEALKYLYIVSNGCKSPRDNDVINSLNGLFKRIVFCDDDKTITEINSLMIKFDGILRDRTLNEFKEKEAERIKEARKKAEAEKQANLEKQIQEQIKLEEKFLKKKYAVKYEQMYDQLRSAEEICEEPIMELAFDYDMGIVEGIAITDDFLLKVVVSYLPQKTTQRRDFKKKSLAMIQEYIPEVRGVTLTTAKYNCGSGGDELYGMYVDSQKRRESSVRNCNLSDLISAYEDYRDSYDGIVPRYNMYDMEDEEW